MGADECNSDVGEYCDVWGIGCILYYMIMGVPIHDNFRHDPHNEIPRKVQLYLYVLFRQTLQLNCAYVVMC